MVTNGAKEEHLTTRETGLGWQGASHTPRSPFVLLLKRQRIHQQQRVCQNSSVPRSEIISLTKVNNILALVSTLQVPQSSGFQKKPAQAKTSRARRAALRQRCRVPQLGFSSVSPAMDGPAPCGRIRGELKLRSKEGSS